MTHPIDPLHWLFKWEDRTYFQKYVLAGLPLVDPKFRLFRHIQEQLRLRTPSAFDLWPQDGAIRSIVNATSPFIANAFHWPNDYFIPEDPFSILFWDVQGDLEIVEADMRLVNLLKLPQDFSFVELSNTTATYGEVVAAILSGGSELEGEMEGRWRS